MDLFIKFPTAMAFIQSLERQKKFFNGEETPEQIFNAVEVSILFQMETFGYDKVYSFELNNIHNGIMPWYE